MFGARAVEAAFVALADRELDTGTSDWTEAMLVDAELSTGAWEGFVDALCGSTVPAMLRVLMGEKRYVRHQLTCRGGPAGIACSPAICGIVFGAADNGDEAGPSPSVRSSSSEEFDAEPNDGILEERSWMSSSPSPSSPSVVSSLSLCSSESLAPAVVPSPVNTRRRSVCRSSRNRSNVPSAARSVGLSVEELGFVVAVSSASAGGAADL